MHARSWVTGAAATGAAALAIATFTTLLVAPPASSDVRASVPLSDAPPIDLSAADLVPADPGAGQPIPDATLPGAVLPDVLSDALLPHGTAPGTAAPTVIESRVSAAAREVAAKRAARASRQQAFAVFTLESAPATDMRGIEGSLYRGRFFSERSEDKRLCIVKRESEGFYDVVNPGGSYFGAYQVSRALARGVTYMMADEHKDLMGEGRAKQVLASLRESPMNTWSRYWQDAAFHTIMNWEGELSGASHWAGGRWHC